MITLHIVWLGQQTMMSMVGYAQFPGLSGLAKTPEGALKGIRNVVENVIQNMRDNKEEVPEPIAKINKFMGDPV